jgi:hypothetical protein
LEDLEEAGRAVVVPVEMADLVMGVEEVLGAEAVEAETVVVQLVVRMVVQKVEVELAEEEEGG